MTCAEFFNKVKKQLGETHALFGQFVGYATGKVIGYFDNSLLCQRMEKTSAATFYDRWMNLLHKLAVRYAQHPLDSVYSEATKIAAVLREVLLREFSAKVQEVIIAPMELRPQ